MVDRGLVGELNVLLLWLVVYLFALHRPHQHRSISLTMTNTKRLLVYIVPVTLLSFALNIPKFMEVSLTKNNGTNEVRYTNDMRRPGKIIRFN